MKASTFRGGFDSLEKQMNEFFEEAGDISIKYVKMVPTNEKDDIGEPVAIALIIYEDE